MDQHARPTRRLQSLRNALHGRFAPVPPLSNGSRTRPHLVQTSAGRPDVDLCSSGAEGTQFYVSLVQGVQNPSFDRELAYARLTLPDAGFQLLALYRFWNIVEYWYPYRDLVGDDWDRVLHDGIAPVVGAKTAGDYQRQLMAVVAKVQDTHANLWSSIAARPPLGACELPVTIRFVEQHPVVIDAVGDLRPGDEVQTLDEVPVAMLVQDWIPLCCVHEPTRLRDIARFVTRGSCGEATIGVRRGTEPCRQAVARRRRRRRHRRTTDRATRSRSSPMATSPAEAVHYQSRRRAVSITAAMLEPRD